MPVMSGIRTRAEEGSGAMIGEGLVYLGQDVMRRLKMQGER